MTSIDRVDLGLTAESGCSCCATPTDSSREPASGAFETEVQVAGMTCSRCVASVTEKVRALEGVLDVAVALAPEAVSAVTISSSVALDPEHVRSAIEAAGYSLATTEGESSETANE